MTQSETELIIIGMFVPRSVIVTIDNTRFERKTSECVYKNSWPSAGFV